MSTLLERLDPEIKKLIEHEYKHRPEVMEGIIEYMRDNETFMTMSYIMTENLVSIPGIIEYMGVEYHEMYMLKSLNKMVK